MELAQWTRELLDRLRIPIRELARRTHYGRDTLSRNLSGDRRPSWEFMQAVVNACAGADEQAKAQLLAEARARWKAADPSRSHPVASAKKTRRLGGAGDPVREQTALEQAQRLTSQAQQVAAYYQLQCQRLLVVQSHLQQALLTVAREREELLRQAARQQAGAELRHVQQLLDKARRELQRTQDLLAVAQAARDRAERATAEMNRRLSSLAATVLRSGPSPRVLPEITVRIVEDATILSRRDLPSEGMPDLLDRLQRADIAELLLAALVYAVSATPLASTSDDDKADATEPQELPRDGVTGIEGKWLILRPVQDAGGV